MTIRTRRQDPEIETSPASEKGQLPADTPALDAEIVEPAVVVEPESRQEE